MVGAWAKGTAGRFRLKVFYFILDMGVVGGRRELYMEKNILYERQKQNGQLGENNWTIEREELEMEVME